MGSMLCPVLVGRDAQVGVLTTALDEARRGGGGVILLTGDAGAGKSRLAREAVDLASSHGFLTLTGRATESAVPVPFRPVTEALIRAARAGFAPDAPQIADYRPALGTLVPDWSEAPGASAAVSALIIAEALLRLLTLPGQAGALIVLEDLQWADPQTLAIVEYLADNLTGTNALCLATAREHEPSAGGDAVRAIGGRDGTNVLEVPRLSDRAVVQMASACLGTQKVPAAVTRLLRDCDGMPFAVEEMLAAAVSSGKLVSGADGWQVDDELSAPVPASITGSVRSRLAALGPAVTDVLASAAVLGRQFDWTFLPRISDQPQAATLTALQEAREVQLIEPVYPSTRVFRFRHSLTRAAILADLLPPDRAMRSASAVAAIENAYPDLPDHWCELAAELHATAGHYERAAELQLAVGHRALRSGTLDAAVTSLRDASALLRREPQVAPMLAADVAQAQVQALALAGGHDELRSATEQALAMVDATGADPRRQALIRISAAGATWMGDPATASAQLAAARGTADQLHDAELHGRIDTLTARWAMYDGELGRAERLARRALAGAEEASRSGWGASVAVDALRIIARGDEHRDVSRARATYERACQIAGDAGLAIERIEALHDLGVLEVLEDGSPRRLTEASELAHQAGAVRSAVLIDLKLAIFSCFGPDLARALAIARQCEQSAHRIGARRVEALATCAQALVSTLTADRREAELIAQRAESIAPDSPAVLFTTWGLARVTASLFQDDRQRALRETTTALSYAQQVPGRATNLAWAFYAFLHALCDDDGPAALAQARKMSSDVKWNRGFFAFAEAVLEGRAGHAEQASALAQEGEALLLPFAPRWRHLLGWLVASDALAGGWGDPIRWLREAAAEFEVGGHHRLASGCRGMLRRAGERVPRAGRGNALVPEQMRRLGVTSREMDVFLLVAEGFSNSDIAGRLVISSKTVDTHVASLIAKTGKAGRRELVAYAAHFVS